ncbi:hypothetical protein V1517DRAFT_317292 [Lipomyces orientalis]|uniref:Uncharacterized protein n=1 Tax=Lipomyces orientalis TaxID=1233043 RepID=A0ACC3TV35_9ASCO
MDSVCHVICYIRFRIYSRTRITAPDLIAISGLPPALVRAATALTSDNMLMNCMRGALFVRGVKVGRRVEVIACADKLSCEGNPSRTIVVRYWLHYVRPSFPLFPQYLAYRLAAVLLILQPCTPHSVECIYCGRCCPFRTNPGTTCRATETGHPSAVAVPNLPSHKQFTELAMKCDQTVGGYDLHSSYALGYGWSPQAGVGMVERAGKIRAFKWGIKVQMSFVTYPLRLNIDLQAM